LLITNEGIVWQFADLLRDSTSHASRAVNAHSIGIEISNYGWTRDPREIPKKGLDRQRYPATLDGGWRTTLADFYPAQHHTILRVCAALLEAFEIPREVALAPWQKRSKRWVQGFSGVMGHLHCTKKRKIDPGPRPLERLAAGLKEN
jgi:N-acetyl-anhydromuramyl-L-alanine amidase AmpD